MAVTMQQVRFEIGDEPKWCAVNGLREVLTPNTDGTTKSYYLRFSKAILSSLRVWTGTSPDNATLPAWTEILAGDATHPWQGAYDVNGLPVLQFTGAAPAAGNLLAVRYLTTAFSDNDLAVYIASNQRADDGTTLKAIHYAIIPVKLNDQERLTVYTLGQRREDASAWIAAQRDLLKDLPAMIDSQPPGTGVAFGWDYGGGASGYQPG